MAGITLYNNIKCSFKKGNTLYVTSKGTNYVFSHFAKSDALVYTINNTQKYIPKQTIIDCKDAANQGHFNRGWFASTFPKQQSSSPCNFSVLKSIV